MAACIRPATPGDLVAIGAVVRAVTAPVNETSIAFHRRIGFAVSDPVPGHDGPGQDRVVFRIDLGEGP